MLGSLRVGHFLWLSRFPHTDNLRSVAVLVLLAPVGLVAALAGEAAGGADLVGVGPGPGLRETDPAKALAKREKTPL